MGISVNFQKRLQELIEDREETQKSKLSQKIGIDGGALSNALNYGIIPKPRTLIRLADYFNVSIPYLLCETNDEYFHKSANPSNFSERFCSLCKERDISHYRVSQDCHFERSYISRWLNKNQLPSFELLELLYEYFNVSIDYLLGRTDERD